MRNVGFIVLSGFVARVLWWAYAEPIPVSDFESYRRLAEGLLERGQLGIPIPSATRLPGNPVFLAIMMMISNSIAWLSFSNVILSTILIYIVYRFAFQLTLDKPLSLVAALICAFNPTFIFFSPILASEHLFVLLLFSAFLVLVCNDFNQFTGYVSRLILAGILFGAAVLTRGDGLFFLPVLLTMTYFASKKHVYRYLLVFVPLLAFVVTIAPWYIRNLYVVGPGSGLSTMGGINFYFAHNENEYGWHVLEGPVFAGKSEAQQQAIGYELGFKYLSEASLLRIARDIAEGTARLYLLSGAYSVEWSTKLPRLKPGTPYPSKQLKGTNLFKELTWAYFILFSAAILSCLFLLRYPLRMWFYLYGIVVMNWIGYAWIFWAKARYRYVSEVVFCILASFILHHIVRYLVDRNSNVRSDEESRLARSPSVSSQLTCIESRSPILF